MGSVKDEPPEAVAEEDRGSQKSERGSAKSGSAKSASVYSSLSQKAPLASPTSNSLRGSSEGDKPRAVPADEAFVSGADISTTGFGELQLSASLAQSLVECWQAFLQSTHTPEAAGEYVCAAVHEGAPIVQALFRTPRAIQGMRFVSTFAELVTAVVDPPRLRALVETLGFTHCWVDVTVTLIASFRDAILDLFAVMLGDQFTLDACEAWKTLLNYCGGSFIFMRNHYAERISTLLSNWKLVSGASAREVVLDAGDGENGQPGVPSEEEEVEVAVNIKESASFLSRFTRQTDAEGRRGRRSAEKTKKGASSVPTTYHEMFMFNAAVIGMADRTWLADVLACFGNMVSHIGNAPRLQEECDILALRIAKSTTGSVNLREYKSCMLSSLRSLLPKNWSTECEVAWSWFWEHVERMLKHTLGRPLTWEAAVGKFLSRIGDENFVMRQEIYHNFSHVGVGSQDVQRSNVFMRFITEKIVSMTAELFKDPVTMVDSISALGLRHVGYGISTELFGPFVTVCISVVKHAADDDDLLTAFTWAFGLMTKILARTITEGSTIVMRAINKNVAREVQKAISGAPRGERASWMLMVQVGTQSISPLAWAIESGSYEAARVMLCDLLSFRADRDRYYYGADDLFARHPDVVQRLCTDAPVLVSTLFDGLLWRSRVTEDSTRRVNYYIKHLLLDQNGGFAPSMEWICDFGDPVVVCHPVINLLSDVVWSGLASMSFLYAKSWTTITLTIFLTSQSIISRLDADDSMNRFLVFACRVFIYGLSLGHFLHAHVTKVYAATRSKMYRWVGYVAIPEYLEDWHEAVSFALMLSLIAMLFLEPIIWCWPNDGEMFHTSCIQADKVMTGYSIFSSLAMFLYYTLLGDLVVFSNRLSAFSLVCKNMCAEVSLCLLAVATMVLVFASAISVLDQDLPEFRGIFMSASNLAQMCLGMVDGDTYEAFKEEPVVLLTCFAFVIVTVFFLLNLLVAQLTCAYNAIYSNMAGLARLQRMRIIVETMPTVPLRRWEKFVASLQLDKKLEFNTGDVGMSGGIQVREPASANPTTVDVISRYGGSTSERMPWPESDDTEDDPEQCFERMEKLMVKTMQRLSSLRDTVQRAPGSGAGTSGEFETSDRQLDASSDDV